MGERLVEKKYFSKLKRPIYLSQETLYIKLKGSMKMPTLSDIHSVFYAVQLLFFSPSRSHSTKAVFCKKTPVLTYISTNIHFVKKKNKNKKYQLAEQSIDLLVFWENVILLTH